MIKIKRKGSESGPAIINMKNAKNYIRREDGHVGEDPELSSLPEIERGCSVITVDDYMCFPRDKGT